MTRKLRLGDRLVAAGIIDKLQLRAALGQQTQWGKTLGRTLLEMRLVEEAQLIPILSEHLNMPAIDLTGRRLNLEAVALLDEEFCREHECVPFDFHEKGKFLDIAMTDAQNASIYDRIRVRTRCNVRPFLAGPDAIRSTTDRAYGEDLQAMKLQFMLTENVFDFGEEEEGGGGDLETTLNVATRSMGIDPLMASDPPAAAPPTARRATPATPAPAVLRDTPPVLEPLTPATGPAVEDHSALPMPSAVALPEDDEEPQHDEPQDDRPEYEAYDDDDADEGAAYEPYEEQAPPDQYNEDALERVAALEERLAEVEQKLGRQDLFVRGLVDQMREIFGQLAAENLIHVADKHPLVQPMRKRRVSRPENPAQPPARARRMTRPDQPEAQEPPARPRRVTRPDAQPQQGQPRQRKVTQPAIKPSRPTPAEEAAPQPRQRRISHPQGVPTTGQQPASRPLRQPRMTEPVEPVSVDIMDSSPADDDVEFLPGTGRLVETPRRPDASAVRPTPPRETSGAESTMPLVNVPPGSQSVVAIDLGTTRSSVATVVDGQVSVLKLPGGDWDMPSVVGFRQDGSVMLGKSAQMMLANDPEHAVSSPKRLMGHRFDELALQPYLAQLGMRHFCGARDEVTLESRGRPITITEVCAHIINLLRLVAERTLKRKVEEVILTTPVTFNDRQYSALMTAAQFAGLEVLEFVPEPVAATLSCVSDPQCKGLVAVYDFGGGTFDFSVVNIGDETMEVVVTNGDGWLGGDDFDEALAGAAANAFWQETNIELRNQATHWKRLLVRAEMTKRKLTDQDQATLRLPGAATTAEGELDLVYPVNREQFAALCRGIIRRSLAACQEALDSEGLTVNDLNAVYLSGGTTHIPAVRQAITEFFGKEPRTVVPPERAVLVGAAVHGALFHGEVAANMVG